MWSVETVVNHGLLGGWEWQTASSGRSVDKWQEQVE